MVSISLHESPVASDGEAAIDAGQGHEKPDEKGFADRKQGVLCRIATAEVEELDRDPRSPIGRDEAAKPGQRGPKIQA
jgi:hypothetical protein